MAPKLQISGLLMFSKRFTPLVVALAALNAGFAQALGLGEITLHSQLDQPLNAEIRLRGMGDLDPDQIIVRLAPAADFERSGVDRLYSLTEMRFDVRSGISGEGVVRIRTEQPVREPYLDFLIEVRWPSGRVLREYTVLLDLPTYSPEPPPVVRAPNAAAPARSARVARADAGGAWSGGGSYDVHSGDTLWSIASRTRPSGVSVQQMLNALHRDNPAAFVNGDIDRLRAGVVLRVPADLSSVMAAADAGGVDGGAPQLAQESPAPPSDVGVASGAAPATADEQAYLRLAGDKTPSGASATGGEPGGTGDGSSAGQGDLAAVQENLSAKERENAELASRVKALEEQVQNYQRIVDLKSDSMAAAQTGAAAPAAGAASPAPAPKPPVAPAPEPGVLDMLLANGVALGAILGALFLGVLGFLVLRRRGETATYGALPDTQQRYRTADRRSEPEVPAAREPTMPPAIRASTVPVSSRPAAVFPASVVAPVATASTFELAASPERDQRERESSDPIGEADIYIAYGRHERAIEVLRLALEGDAERNDVRLKLLEVLAERGEQVAFIAEYDQLLALGGDDDVAVGREIAIGSGHPHWLAELDAPSGIQSAPVPEPLSPLPAPSLSRVLPEDEPAADLASLVLEEQGLPPVGEFDLDLGLDLDLDVDLDAGDHDVFDEEELESGFGELDIGELDIAGVTAAEAMPSVLEAAPGMLGDEPADADLNAVGPDTGAAGVADLLAPASADAEEEAADFDLLEGTDEVETRIELAKAFIDMGDVEGARDILEEVLAEGSQAQRETAMALLDTLKPA
jgi:pilus assembly protein FimV